MTEQDAATLPAAYYLPVQDDERTAALAAGAGDDADVFDSTIATSSPWDETMQHGGPPAALLARAIERLRPDAQMPISRLTIDMLGPIPQGRIVTTASILRPGKRIELVEAKLWAEGRLAVTATAWRIRRSPGSTAEHAHDIPAVPIPEFQEQRYFPGVSPDWGYGRSIEWRFASGALDEQGPANVWARPRIPLVAGEETSPTQNAAIVADSANGVSGELPLADWLFIPPTLTVTFGREPEGGWVNLDVRTIISGDGTGIATGDLSDVSGFVGRIAQPLLVSRR